MPLTACLLHYDPASCWSRARLRFSRTGAEAKASLNRAPSVRGRRPETEAIYPWPG